MWANVASAFPPLFRFVNLPAIYIIAMEANISCKFSDRRFIVPTIALGWPLNILHYCSLTEEAM